MRFEAHERPQLVEYMKRFRTLLQAHPEVDISRLSELIDRYSAEAAMH
jgi:hypothetical protein